VINQDGYVGYELGSPDKLWWVCLEDLGDPNKTEKGFEFIINSKTKGMAEYCPFGMSIIDFPQKDDLTKKQAQRFLDKEEQRFLNKNKL
jgi:hypothetical protein